MAKQLVSRRRFVAGLGLGTIATAAGCDSRQAVDRAEVRQWDYSADVVIAGSGAAGIFAALEGRGAGAGGVGLGGGGGAGGRPRRWSAAACVLAGGRPRRGRRAL